MKVIKMLRTCCLFSFIFFCFSSAVEAQKVYYFFDGKELGKKQELTGKTEQIGYCTDWISTAELNIFELAQYSDVNYLFISPDEQYFIFQSTYKSKWLYFLLDIKDCKVVRDLTIDKKYEQIDYSAAFLPRTAKLYASWHLLDKNGVSFWQTIEYSGDGFKTERFLKNIQIPTIASDGKGYYSYFFKFSKDEKLLVTVEKNSWIASIYSVSDDVKIASFNVMDFKKQKFVMGEGVPDIEGGFLLYSFVIEEGTEINVFDYIKNKLENKLEIPAKGIGKFASDGEKVIFTTFPDSKMIKKDVIVYERKTGKKLGRASLDALAEVVDVSVDGKKLIYKKNGNELAVDVSL